MSNAQNIRIVTWNIACGAQGYHQPNINGISELINSIHPDVVLLQEVDQNVPRSGNVDVTAAIAAQTGFDHHFTSAHDQDGGHFGNAVLAKKITTRHGIALGPENGDPHNWETSPRAACVAIVPLAGLEIACASVHLASTAARPSSVRREQVEVLAQYLDSLKADFRLAAGDFNIEEPSPDCIPLRSRYANAADSVGPTCSLAGPEGLIWSIDHVWIEQPTTVRLTHKIARPELSDHCLVFSDVFFGQEPV